MKYQMSAESGFINISPIIYKREAENYLKCALSFTPEGFSSVQYFLCCRAIELALKAIHLDTVNQQSVKKSYAHYLVKSYNSLPADKKNLSQDEYQLLEKADDIYSNDKYSKKGFEYIHPIHPATAYKRFPDLDRMFALTQKIVTAIN